MYNDGVRGLKFGLCLRLYSFSVYASSEGPGRSAYVIIMSIVSFSMKHIWMNGSLQ